MQHEECILLRDKFFLDICFSWFKLRNMLRDKMDSCNETQNVTYRFIDSKDVVDQGRLPHPRLQCRQRLISAR